MRAISQRDFTGNLFRLLAETFEGPPVDGGAAYLDRGAGLFQTLDAITAEVASRPPHPGAPTVAGHCAHTLYYVRVLHGFVAGAEPIPDWPGSWATREVDDAGWDALRRDLRAGYEALTTLLRSLEGWDDDPIGDAMAIVVHTAYHLGAIRQLASTAGGAAR